MEHSIVDWILGIGGIAATISAVFLSIFIPRRLANNSRSEREASKQGDRINHHTTEIRHIQRQANIIPFDPNWDR